MAQKKIDEELRKTKFIIFTGLRNMKESTSLSQETERTRLNEEPKPRVLLVFPQEEQAEQSKQFRIANLNNFSRL